MCVCLCAMCDQSVSPQSGFGVRWKELSISESCLKPVILNHYPNIPFFNTHTTLERATTKVSTDTLDQSNISLSLQKEVFLERERERGRESERKTHTCTSLFSS